MLKTFLSPMSPDGKAGEQFGIQFDDDEAPKYLEPFVENDATAKLRHDLHVARSRLQHAKARGKGVAEAQKNLEAAKAAVGQIHHDQGKAREQQRTGTDHGAPSPLSRDTRQFMPVSDYSRNVDEGDYDEADDPDDDALEAKILAAVTALEEAQSNGASPAVMKKLEEALKVLREQLQAPLREKDPSRRTTAPTGRAGDPNNDGLVVDPTAKGKKAPAGQAAAPAVKTQTGWDKFLADFDAKQAKKALAAIRTAGAASATHAQNTCCSGKYLCASCRRKQAATS
jgi:hypothetical protein